MLEAKYFKDYKHNYMILQCGREAAARSYQYKILTSDKIREILKCSVRHINGVTYYYYDISSRTTLKSLYQSSKMSCGQVKDLLWQLHGICDKLAGFFMEESGLVLLPEHIYYDFSNRKYIGLYYPDYQITGRTAYEPLMNFLLEHIDTEDRQFVEKMYRICEMAGETHFVIEDALHILEERNEPEPETEAEQPAFFQGMDMAEEEREPLEPFRAETQEAQDRKRSLFYPVCAALSVLGMAGAAAVYCLFDLVREEETALYGVMAVLGFCLLFSLWGMARQAGRGKEGKGQAKSGGRTAGGTGGMPAGMPEDVMEGLSGMPADRDAVSLQDIISRDMPADVPQRQTMQPGSWAHGGEPSYEAGEVRRGYANGPSSGAVSFAEEQETDYYGNTVFFDGRKQAEYKLYAIDKRNKQHIMLQQFPCTIGKMAGCVDHVLADNSVSRIHARFDRQGDKILLTDMNSTNGTYKNGLRMQPQETVEIEPGDEIRFGNLNYCYR